MTTAATRMRRTLCFGLRSVFVGTTLAAIALG